LCTTVKNDVAYIVEWIEFMKLQGVQRFIIYNDEATDGLDLLNKFYENRSTYFHVHVIPRAGRPRYQLVSFQHCIDHYGSSTEWILISDTDEFVYSPAYITLKSMLLDMPRLEQESGGNITWIYAECSRFGSNGQKRRFQYRLVEQPDGSVKYVNGCGVQMVLNHTRRAPHLAHPKEHELAVRLKSSEMCTKHRENDALGCNHGHGKSLFRPEHILEVGCHTPARMDGAGIQGTVTRRRGPVEFLAWCNHYSTRSREDAYRKAIIGWRVSSVAGVVSLYNETDAQFFGQVEDPLLHKIWMNFLYKKVEALTTVEGECLPEPDD
jgi:hypothetical protein